MMPVIQVRPCIQILFLIGQDPHVIGTRRYSVYKLCCPISKNAVFFMRVAPHTRYSRSSYLATPLTGWAGGAVDQSSSFVKRSATSGWAIVPLPTTLIRWSSRSIRGTCYLEAVKLLSREVRTASVHLFGTSSVAARQRRISQRFLTRHSPPAALPSSPGQVHFIFGQAP